MTAGTCLNIRSANSVTRVQQSRFPKFVNDIFSAFGTFSRVRCVCVPCAALVRSCAALCGVVRRCALLCGFFVRPTDQPPPTSDLCLPLLYR
jgi:hypothetical protein